MDFMRSVLKEVWHGDGAFFDVINLTEIYTETYLPKMRSK